MNVAAQCSVRTSGLAASSSLPPAGLPPPALADSCLLTLMPPRHTGEVQRALAAAPGIAATANVFGELPLHLAACGGHAAAVRLLLAAHPAAVHARTAYDATPLTLALFGPTSGSGQNLCEPDGAAHAQRAATVQLLLDTVPEAAAAVDEQGRMPLHVAAQIGCPEVVAVLLAAAPEAALVRDAAGRLPLHRALLRVPTVQAMETARCLLGVGSAQQLLPVLVGAGELAAPLFASLVARLPLTTEEWQLVPAGCRGLGTALPAVLARSEQEARLLVQRLQRVPRQRLHTFALCLASRQRQLGVELPPVILCRILASFNT